MTKLKGMTFDHDFGYSFPLFSSLLKKEGRRKGEFRKIVKQSHAFQPGLIFFYGIPYNNS